MSDELMKRPTIAEDYARRRAILTALAQHGQCSKSRIAALTGYAVNGGGFNNAISRLRTLELVEGKGSLRLAPDFAAAVRR